MQRQFETPVLFLIFNRPDTTRIVFDQIQKIKPTHLFIAADAARVGVSGEKEKCEAARRIVDQVDWVCEINTLFREKNLGCGPAISSAIDWFFTYVEEGIILEDDCYPHLSFFPYCQELLRRYRNEEQVKVIGGNNFQGSNIRGNGSYYFSHYPEIWGWATWRRAWKEYDFRMTDLDTTINERLWKQVFNTRQESGYYEKKFLQTKSGAINTWDYQLMYSILKNGGLVVTPQVNLVKNIGINNHPTHRSLRDSKINPECEPILFPLRHPDMVVDRAADTFTFSQLYSKSPQRIIRLIKENGLRKFLTYTWNNLHRS